MKDTVAHADMDRAWRQLLRWMIADVPARVQCSAEPIPADANGTMRVQIRVRDEKFQPVDDAMVTVGIEPVVFQGTDGAAAAPIKLEAEPALTEPGLYQVSYVPRQTGGYRAVATVKNETTPSKPGERWPTIQSSSGWSTRASPSFSWTDS